ncbi:hypothetical protein QF042_005009 [Pedobacter sp. W3I1]|nr:hypothetical protein [Pedobacter sp. W3I1]
MKRSSKDGLFLFNEAALIDRHPEFISGSFF